MTLHIDNAATETAVRALADRLGTDDASVIDALVLDAFEELEQADSYAQRRNARVRLRILTDRVDTAARRRSTPDGPVATEPPAAQGQPA